MASSYDVTIKLYNSRVESVMRAVNAMNVQFIGGGKGGARGAMAPLKI